MTGDGTATDGEEALVAGVDARYQAMQPRSWEAPEWDSPPQWAYSRVTDSGRFAVLGLRVQAWYAELAAHGVVVEDITASDRPAWRFGQQLRLSSPRPGTVPLFVWVAPVEEDADTVGGVLVAFGDPGVEVARVPDCTCDACDRGSEPLLRAVDEAVLSVVTGRIEVTSTDRALIVTSRDGSARRSPNEPDVPRGHWVGGPWW